MYKAKVAACSDIRTKHSTQSEHHVEFLNVKTWRYVKKPLGFKRLLLFKKRVGVDLDSRTKRIHTLRVTSNGITGGIHSYHRMLRGLMPS